MNNLFHLIVLHRRKQTFQENFRFTALSIEWKRCALSTLSLIWFVIVFWSVYSIIMCIWMSTESAAHKFKISKLMQINWTAVQRQSAHIIQQSSLSFLLLGDNWIAFFSLHHNGSTGFQITLSFSFFILTIQYNRWNSLSSATRMGWQSSRKVDRAPHFQTIQQRPTIKLWWWKSLR